MSRAYTGGLHLAVGFLPEAIDFINSLDSFNIENFTLNAIISFFAYRQIIIGIYLVPLFSRTLEYTAFDSFLRE